MLLVPVAPGPGPGRQSQRAALPRFVSTRSDPINVRVGPGTKYEIAWTYLKPGVPVEIVQEFDTWRKIRDVDGEEGWVHQNLLAGTRTGYVTPIVANGEIAAARRAVRRCRHPRHAGARPARADQGLRRRLVRSQRRGQAEGGRSSTYSGFLHQEELWGVYPDEIFD